MATLNIKNLSDSLYRKLKERAKREHRSIAQQVTHILETELSPPDLGSVLELRGLGKELWKGGEATRHVDDEREAWD